MYTGVRYIAHVVRYRRVMQCAAWRGMGEVYQERERRAVWSFARKSGFAIFLYYKVLTNALRFWRL